VNAIAPGFIETEKTEATADRKGIAFEVFKASAAKSIAVGRVGQPDDVAAVTSFYSRDDASLVTSQIVYVAGGPRG